jgi:hypothetical protein
MTPKEKAEELFSTYRYALSMPNAPLGEHKDDIAKKCALIAVNEILEDREEIDGMMVINDPYWQEVKQEIEKL